MISKQRRIGRKKLQKLLATRAKTRESEHLHLRVLPDDERQGGVALVVPSKTYNKAALRNRLRRTGYAIIRKHLDRIDSTKNFIFFFRGNAADISHRVLEREVVSLLKSRKARP